MVQRQLIAGVGGRLVVHVSRGGGLPARAAAHGAWRRAAQRLAVRARVAASHGRPGCGGTCSGTIRGPGCGGEHGVVDERVEGA